MISVAAAGCSGWCDDDDDRTVNITTPTVKPTPIVRPTEKPTPIVTPAETPRAIQTPTPTEILRNGEKETPARGEDYDGADTVYIDGTLYSGEVPDVEITESYYDGEYKFTVKVRNPRPQETERSTQDEITFDKIRFLRIHDGTDEETLYDSANPGSKTLGPGESYTAAFYTRDILNEPGIDGDQGATFVIAYDYDGKGVFATEFRAHPLNELKDKRRSVSVRPEKVIDPNVYYR